MKTISKFTKRESYGKRYDTVEVIELETEYVLRYKYTSMKKEEIRIYKTLDLAMYDYCKKVMFLLS